MNATQPVIEPSKATQEAVSQEPLLWQIDPVHSSAHFSVRHMMVSNVRGEISNISGAVKLYPGDPGRSSVEAVLDASSIQTREPARDAHLRSADFLDVEKFPNITFKSMRVEGSMAEGLRAMGNLTIHGVTREVALEVEPLSPEIKDPYGNIRMGTSAATKIDRRDFGLTWNAALETGGLLVGTEIKITLEIELTKTAGADAK
jgi:polyisoprenoid-binding protein YceI